jgi:ubiquinone/menaquinone biosynthesis C-methylase UbiE
MRGHRLFATFYDICARLTDRQLRPLRAFAAGGARGRVLEIGCGTGANFAYYDWSKVESVDAVDPDPFMLAQAESKVARAPEGKIRLQEAPAEALPFPNAFFDTVVCTLVLCTVQDAFEAIREVRRVLKSEGEFRIAEHVRGQGRTARLQDFVQPVYGWFAAGCVLGRPTELTLAAAGISLEVEDRPHFGPGMPGVMGVGRIESGERSGDARRGRAPAA